MWHGFIPESLDQLTEWVVEKFSQVPNKDISVPTYEGHPLTTSELMVGSSAVSCRKPLLK